MCFGLWPVPRVIASIALVWCCSACIELTSVDGRSCDETHGCRSAEICVAGVCRATGAGGGTAGVGGGSGTFVDNFDQYPLGAWAIGTIHGEWEVLGPMVSEGSVEVVQSTASSTPALQLSDGFPEAVVRWRRPLSKGRVKAALRAAADGTSCGIAVGASFFMVTPTRYNTADTVIDRPPASPTAPYIVELVLDQEGLSGRVNDETLLPMRAPSFASLDLYASGVCVVENVSVEP